MSSARTHAILSSRRRRLAPSRRRRVMPPLHRRRSDCASERRLPLTDDDIYWAGGKLLPSFQLALPSHSQTFLRIYLTSYAFVRPCSMCYVCCCGGGGTGFRRADAEGNPRPLFRRHFLLLLRSEEIYPLFPPERQMQSRYGQASGRTMDGRRKQSLRSIYRQSNARRQMAARLPRHLCHSQHSLVRLSTFSLLRLAV